MFLIFLRMNALTCLVCSWWIIIQYGCCMHLNFVLAFAVHAYIFFERANSLMWLFCIVTFSHYAYILISKPALVTYFLSDLPRPYHTLFSSSAKSTFLNHCSSVFVWASLPEGYPCQPVVWLSDVLSYGQIFKLMLNILSSWHLHPSIQMPRHRKFAFELCFYFFIYLS